MQLDIRQYTVDLSTPNIMGILNVTPDSFSDGGKYYLKLSKSIDYVASMIASGANFIDVGGESTRPGADEISAEEEAMRVIPVIIELIKRFDVFISVNTSKSLVINESVSAGVHLINDIRALREPGALKAVANSKLPVCLMHMQGSPHNMQKNPHYHDILTEINSYFMQQISRYEAAGIKKKQIILDPGFGFGKNLIHNYYLLSKLTNFHHFNLPILVGMSRKSMIGQLTGSSVKKRVIGSITCAVIAAMQGVHIIRVHDVKETVEALQIVKTTISTKGTIFI